jgi:hypothetical protein
MAGLTSAVLFFKPSATPGNAATGFITARNAVATNDTGIIVADTAVGVLQTGQSIAAVINSTSKLIPGAGAVLGLAGGGLAATHIYDDVTAGRPVAISDVASLAANALTVVGSVAALAVLIVPATLVGGAASVILVPVTFLAVAAGGVQYATTGFSVDNSGKIINTNFTPAQKSYLDSLTQAIRLSPDGVTPLNVNFTTTSGNTRTDIAWTQDANTGNYFKYETISTLRSDKSIVSASQTQYKYNTDGSPLSGVSNAIDGNGKVTGAANLVIGSDGKTWVVATGTAPVIIPGTTTSATAPPVHIDTLGIQTDAVPNSDSLTITSTINNQTGATSAVLRDGTGNPVLSAAAGQQLVRDPSTGIFIVTTAASQAQEIYDPFTGNRLFVQADGSGMLAGRGIDANGFPNPDVYFNAGGLTKNVNGSVTITPIPNGDGTAVPAVSVFNPTDTYSTAANNPDGSATYAVSNRAGEQQSSAIIQTFDDGTQLVTVNYPSGVQTIISTASDNTSKQVDLPVPTNPNIQTTTTRDSIGIVTATRTITPSLDEENNPIANTYDVLTLDGAGHQLSSGTLQVNPIDGSLTESVYTPPAAGELFGGVAVTTTTPAGVVRPNNNSAAMVDFERGGGAFLALNSLFNARNAQPLGQAGAVVGGLNTGLALAEIKVPALTGLGAGIGFVSAVTSLASAWDRSDLGGGLVALDSTITSGAQLYLLANDSTLTVAQVAANGGFGAASEAIGAASEACPYLLIAYDLETGNYGGAIGGAIGLYFGGPIGSAVGEAIGTLIQSFFSEPDEPPPPSGTAYVIFTDAGGIRITAAGVSGGDAIASNRLSGLLLSGGGLNDLIGKHNTTVTADLSAILVGIVPQRLGAISYDNTPSYRVSSTDPITGQDPGLIFNGITGRLLNPQPGSSAYFQTLDQYYTSNALARQAIAPLWEVATAKAQQDHGLSNSGLSESERAANLGHLAPRLVAGQTTEHFNPIGIDLNGDGLATIAESGSGVYFDIDGTADLGAKLQGINAPHYLKHTAWLNNQDGLLILDKNINGTIDDGEEMFSNSAVNEQSRGIASLAVIDADGNGSIDASDPVFGSLRVWQDKNSNGLLEAGEVKSLSALGISSLNYETGTVTRSGQLAQMSTLTLEADTLGTSYMLIPVEN